MATAELRPPACRWLPHHLGRVWLRAYCVVWALTLVVAAVVGIAGGDVRALAVSVIGAHLTPGGNPPARLSPILLLAAHNLPVVAWPLLLGVERAHAHPLSRSSADLLVIASVIANVVPVGAAIGAYGSALVAYIPQLPVEWAAVALGASAWMVQRRRPVTAREGAAMFVLLGGVVVCAAAMEVCLVPHR